MGCLLTGAFACVVSVDDNLDDDVGGASGGSNVSGSSGSNGTSGASGNAGSGGQSGSGGSMSMVENGGTGGSTATPAPVCSAEAGDAEDPCLSCIKVECCPEWQACTDSSCQLERADMVECVSELAAPDSEGFGDCASMVSAADDGLLQENTLTLFDCVNDVAPVSDAGEGETRCGVECFGSDIF
ncbi:MAG: hypothetical protein ABI895_07595 [Deltaproteobacteria bacterium]